MRSIEALFRSNVYRYPGWSDYMCFANAVGGRGFSERVIARNFAKLVSCDDVSDRRAVLGFLYRHTVRK